MDVIVYSCSMQNRESLGVERFFVTFGTKLLLNTDRNNYEKNFCIAAAFGGIFVTAFGTGKFRAD